MNYDKLKRLWKKEEMHSFKGWDFSYLENRWEEEDLPWDYRDILKKYLNSEYKLLDMGTSGGEFLLSLMHPYNNTSVTEMWEPNIRLCKEKLEPLGIEVKQVFKDIGAIVYFAKIIEWEFPNFSVDNCFEELCKLNEQLNIKGLSATAPFI